MESSVVVSYWAEHNAGFLALIGIIITVVIYYLNQYNIRLKIKKIKFDKFNNYSKLIDPQNMKSVDSIYFVEISIKNATGQDLTIQDTEVFNEESEFEFKYSKSNILKNNTSNTLVISHYGNSDNPTSITLTTSIAKYKVYYDGRFILLE